MSADPDVAALKATIRAQGIEIRDLKAALASSSSSTSKAIGELDAKLDALVLQMQPLVIAGPALNDLLNEAQRAKGMAQLGKVLAGGGVFTAIGAAATGIYHYFIGAGHP